MICFVYVESIENQNYDLVYTLNPLEVEDYDTVDINMLSVDL